MTRGRVVSCGVAVALFCVVAFAPLGLRDSAAAYGDRPALAAAVFALMAVLWFTEAIPIAWTAALPLALFPALDVFGNGVARGLVDAALPYVDAYIFLFMGGIALGAAMEEQNLHRRVALHIMRRIGSSPRRLLIGMIVATAAVSLWISNTATAVMMMPIGLALVREIEFESGKARLASFGAAVMLAVAYASNVGGIGTKIGTGTNSIFVGFVSAKLGRDIGFLEYAAVGLPFVCLFLPIVWMVLWRIARRDGLAETRGRDAIARTLASLGPISRAEKRVALVFLAAAALWIGADPIRSVLAPLMNGVLGTGFKLLGKHVEATIAILAALSLIALRVLSFRALRRAPWGTLVLLGGSFSLAAAIEGSGLGVITASALSGLRDLSLLSQIGIATFATVFLSAVASNTATINVMLNVLPPNLPVLTASALGASCDFMLPAGTPPNAIVFGSGYIRLRTMIRAGFVLDLIAIALLTLYAYAFVPLFLS